jgi:hypothetical protein
METPKESPVQPKVVFKPASKKQGSKKGLVIFVILLLLSANGLLLWQFFNKNSELSALTLSSKELEKEKTDLSAELAIVKGDIEKAKGENANLQSQLSSKDAEIQEMTAKIEKLIKSGDAAQLASARRQLADLRELSKTYLVQIDSLRTLNQNLNNQNETLNTDLTSTKAKIDTLSVTNVTLSNKVAVGSILKADKIKITGVKFKSSGKEYETPKASSVQKIKSCFTVQENRVVDGGPLDVYIRVIGPDGAVLSTTSETFMYNGQATIYTTKQEIQYNNANADLCVYWAKGSEYPKGNYNVEIYAGGNQIGTSKLALK